MPKSTASPSRRVVLKRPKGGGPATFRNEETGEVLVLRGYGSMKGKLELREGIDLAKPIYEQVLKLEAREKRKASAKRGSQEGPMTRLLLDSNALIWLAETKPMQASALTAIRDAQTAGTLFVSPITAVIPAIVSSSRQHT
jgi:hypothetical protein